MPTAQTITFAPLLNLAAKPSAAITLVATATSSLAVTFSVTSGPATVSADQLTITGAGTIIVQASQAGDSTYSAATPVSRSFTVASLSGAEVDAHARSAGAGREAFVLAYTLGLCDGQSILVTQAKVNAAQQNGETPYTPAGRAAIAALVAAA